MSPDPTTDQAIPATVVEYGVGRLHWSLRRSLTVPIVLLVIIFMIAFLGIATCPMAQPISTLLLWSFVTLCHAVEAICGMYAVCFVYASIRYLRRRAQYPIPAPATHFPPVGVIYVCCNDLEEGAVESLSKLRYPGRLVHILHDDSRDPVQNGRVDALIKRMNHRHDVQWQVLRRTDKSGGKPGALNHVLHATAGQHEFFLLADNDSYALDSDVITKAMGSFADERVAIVQLRNEALIDEDEGAFASVLAGSIDVFDAFMTGLFAPLWKPFVGHNALLRTSAVIEAGSFTPGFFADDIDLTVRLNLRGQQVAYRRDIAMQERHPTNYRSFCLRSKKWAHGCAQVIRTHGWSVVRSGTMIVRQKFGFALFSGFYLAQATTLAYVILVFLLLPLLTPQSWDAQWWALTLGTFMPLAMFAPVLTYLATEGKHRPLWKTLAACAATYGSTDLWTILGLRSGMRREQQRWIPTNSVLSSSRPWLDWLHFWAGVSFLIVPLWRQPQLLLFPLTWVFAAKFMFVPAVAAMYQQYRPVTDARARSHFRLARVAVAWLVLVCALATLAMAPSVHGSLHWWDDETVASNQATMSAGLPPVVRGVHYSPWRGGTGPGRGFEYPESAALASDLDQIAALHANTVLVYDPPARLLDLCAARRLSVICVFNIQWWRLVEQQGNAVTEEIVQAVRQLHDRPAVIAWMLGNEIPGWVIDRLTPAHVRGFLSNLRLKVREIDLTRPVCHGNWPLARTYDLDQDMDLLCYNVYPFYPTEVPAMGYGRFIERQIKPLARGRPVLISEFGVNTIEVEPQRQAEVLRSCWQDLLHAGCRGGVVFEFSDEWWKNYDNPVTAPDWWRRQPAPDDHLVEDQDPEEHYGVVRADRTPKPAYETVQAMFASAPTTSTAPSASAPAGASSADIRVPEERGLKRVLLSVAGAGAFAVVGLALWLCARGHKCRA